MKKVLFIILSIALATSVFAQKKGAAKTTKPAETKIELKTFVDSVSYALGMDVGRSIVRNKIELNQDIFIQSIKNHVAEVPSLYTDEVLGKVMQAFQQIMGEKQKEMVKAMTEKNKKEGEAFLAANKTKEGVVTTPSGLQYKIITKGTGKIPTAQDTVVCHYKGSLLNGTVFDESYKRNEPATFPVTGVIKGWIEALQMMPVGSKWELYIPADLAYGDQGAGQVIAPGSALIFEIELISIK